MSRAAWLTHAIHSSASVRWGMGQRIDAEKKKRKKHLPFSFLLRNAAAAAAIEGTSSDGWTFSIVVSVGGRGSTGKGARRGIAVAGVKKVNTPPPQSIFLVPLLYHPHPHPHPFSNHGNAAGGTIPGVADNA